MSAYNTTEESTLTVPPGQAAVLSLPPVDSYPPPSVSWMADDGSLLYGIKYATTEPDNRFVILSTETTDMKTYK